MNIKTGQATGLEMLPFFIIIGLFLLFIIVCLRVASAAHRVTVHAIFNHVSGLSLAENAICKVNCYPDRLEFKSGSMQLKLAKSQITDVSMKTDTEIQKQDASGIGDDADTAVRFGRLSTIIKRRANENKSRTVYTYLIITYKNENFTKYIGFDVTDSLLNAGKIIDEIKKNNKIVSS